jgi:hypothetical protein
MPRDSPTPEIPHCFAAYPESGPNLFQNSLKRILADISKQKLASNRESDTGTFRVS